MKKSRFGASLVSILEVLETPGQRTMAGPGGRGGWWGKAHFSHHRGGSLIFVGRSGETPREPLF